MKHYHFYIKNRTIVCDNGHGEYRVIADIRIERSCAHLVRHAQLAEDIEGLMDKFVSDTSGTSPAVTMPLPEAKE